MLSHLLIDILRNSILITGLVVIMMMMIESFNIESHGKFFSGLRSSRLGQVTVGALLGSIPGCMGGFATVSLYTHGMMSFGALTAMMIASSGDEAFIMLAMIPDKAMLIFTVLFAVAIAAGLLTDIIRERRHRRHCHKDSHVLCAKEEAECKDGYTIHSEDESCIGHGNTGHRFMEGKAGRHLGWKRIVMFLGVAIFIAALGGGMLEHSHAHGGEHEEICSCHDGHSHGAHCNDLRESDKEGGNEFTIDLLSEDWMNIMFAALSVIVLAVLVFGSDHFVEQHLWKHVVVKHLPSIFAWTFGVLALIGIGMHYIDIGHWINDNTALMILLAVAVGIIPESGPHLIFVTLYASGVIPLPVLLASCISQDGHASLPLLAESKSSFIKAKAINCAVALAAGFTAMLFI
ncbi:MAG: putative manganese transporter [Bacteroidales bacterium]|nr:putative manganese transporter [Bacteroidales bacterium]